MTLAQTLLASADPVRSRQMADYHKAPRQYLGVSNPVINQMAARARRDMPLPDRLEEAAALWRSNIHECRVLAAKLFEQKRIEPDGAVWALICQWVADFDGWAIADHVAKSGAFRLIADPARLDVVESWTTDRSLWIRRAALVMTLPWARLRDPGHADIARRERVLGWASGYVSDPEWFIQKCVAWWLRELSDRDPERVIRFVRDYGAGMKAFARKEALRNIEYPALKILPEGF